MANVAINVFLDNLESRFLTPAASDMARVDFKTACQKPQETVLIWHARLREHFIRAYPAVNNVEQDRSLIDQFVMGITDPEVQQYVWDRREATYGAALDSATNRTASKNILSACRTGNRANRMKQEPGIHALQQSNVPYGPEGPCQYCNRTRHGKNDCFKRQSDEANGHFLTHNFTHRDRKSVV